MKYEKPSVNKIIFSNEDILAASPHKCPNEPGSDGCSNAGELCDWLQRIGSCTRVLFTNYCSQSAGANSVDPTVTM